MAVSRLASIAIAIAIVIVIAITAGCGGREVARERAGRPARHLLLVTLDTLRADYLGSYGRSEARTPHLDALARRGTRFEQATTVTPLTLPAHSSLFTGTYPAFHGVRDNGGFYLGDEHSLLAEVLAASGYRTGGFVGAFVLDSRWGIAQGFEHFYDEFDLTEFDDAAGMDAVQRSGAVVVDHAIEWLQAQDERPFFAWVHLYDPHTPYDAPEPYRSRFPDTLSGAYDAEIAWTDALFGRLIAALEADHRLQETLVVVLADHGEMLREHDELTHGFFIYDAAVRIPLILAGPGVPAGVVPDQVRILDVMPTVLARLGIEPPTAVQGVDLSPLMRGERLRLLAHSESWFPRFHYGWSELLSIQDGRFKLIRAPRPELFDLSTDPRELDNLAERNPERVETMDRALDRLLTEVSNPDAVAGPQPVDEETTRRLQALGYLGGAAERNLERPARGDPKDKIVLYNRLKQATAASAAGRLDEAVQHVEQALAEDPEIVEAHFLLGNFHRKAERFETAVTAYRKALELDPEHREAIYALALAYKEMDRLDEALTGLERAAALDSKNGKVMWQKADVLMRQKRLPEAEKELLAALEADLDRPRFLLKLGECYLEMKRPADAERRLREALATNPTLQRGQYTLALALEEQGRTAAAIDAYRAELATHPEAFRASFNLAKLLLAGGDLAASVESFRRAVELQPDFGTGHLYLAKALLDLGELDEAAEAARTGLEKQPAPDIAPLGHFVLADVYSRQGRGDDAAREAAKGRRLAAAQTAGG